MKKFKVQFRLTDCPWLFSRYYIASAMFKVVSKLYFEIDPVHMKDLHIEQVQEFDEKQSVVAVTIDA